MKKQTGFTLIELMISLVLGLVVVAAATMLFITGVRSQAMQQGVSDLQDNANFGLNYITQDVRLANLQATKAAVNQNLIYGGIVLSPSNLVSGLSGTNANLLSFSGTGVSNVNLGSDQLVIQYQPVATGGFDCEGIAIDDVDEIIVQRYFLRIDDNAGPGEGNPLALACDAGRYRKTAAAAIEGYGNSSEIIMKRVDQFRVLLNVQDETNGLYRYMDIAAYNAIAGAKPRILGVNLGVLTRSNQNVGNDPAIAQDDEFRLLDQDLTITAQGNPQGFIRRAISQEVALRNASGEIGRAHV